MKLAIPRWMVPGVATGSIVVPLLMGGCLEEEDAPFWYGIPGCEACSDCYDEYIGFVGGPGPDEMPEEFEFTGDPPTETSLPGGDPDSEAETGTNAGTDDEAASGSRRVRPTGIPDGVLRPNPDRPNVELHTGQDAGRSYHPPQSGGSPQQKVPKPDLPH
ncbi:MAG: hypothetical protein HKP30_12150 [Myxococcales bacterium]|nr:hypothetical protein [Myxococcales bacterium]